MTLLTDDDSTIYIHYTGILYYPDAAKVRLRAGERIDRSEYYQRSMPRFETGAPGLEGLDRCDCVGVGQPLSKA
ncbi:MAG: hypothetical protein ACI8PT_003450 [Gammaproteobacteria bacterium]|jgi:hypothetical protein